ncbi:hypothetical protein BD410DRAFT_154549 [Rickenella mellea]|uniref:Uncharacterized protein n=1 Tax=Rickenella mellea TaxID=50990 RepID=A0A4Y7PHI4_9AGAM|nr:hypothetical protein BD410DRAFT_154549 [Rickenella mellea]
MTVFQFDVHRSGSKCTGKRLRKPGNCGGDCGGDVKGVNTYSLLCCSMLMSELSASHFSSPSEHPGDVFSFDVHDVPTCSHTHSSLPPSERTTMASNDNNALSAPPPPQYVSNGGSGSFLSISAAFGRNTTHLPFRLLQETHGLDSEHIVLFTMI